MKHRLSSSFLTAGVACALASNAPASITPNYQMKTGATSGFDSVIKTNLIRAGQSSLGSAVADPSALAGTFYSSGLNDGTAAANANQTYYYVTGTVSTMPNSAVFELTAGYNITNIQVISAWGDHNLGEQRFQVQLAVNGGAFANFGLFTNNTHVTTGTGASGVWLTTLTDTSGTIATNVTGIKFVFMNPDTGNGTAAVGTSQAGNGSEGGTVIRELQVFGTYYTNLSAPPIAAVIPVTDSNVVNGLTRNNWVMASNYIDATVDGASLAVGFNGTSNVALQVDNSQFAGVAAARYPVIAWSVDGGAYQNHQLTATETSVPLATGVTNPVIDFYIEGMSPFENRYSGNVPPNSVKITGFLVDSNCVTSPVGIPGKVWLNIGDSIMSGDAALYSAGQGRPPDDNWSTSDDGRASYGYLLARHYGYQETRIAYGGYDWGGISGNVPALSTLIDQKTSTISRLSNGFLNPVPDVAVINLGENGAPAASDVTSALVKLRSRVKPSTKIIVMNPVSGMAAAQITQDFNSYTNSSSDTNAFLVNLGSFTYDTADGQHPTAAGHQVIYQHALPAFDPIISPPILQHTQTVHDVAGFDADIAVNLVQAGQPSLDSVVVSHGPSISNTFSTTGLNDGSATANSNLTYYGVDDPSGGNLPVSITFNLNTNIASSYVIDSIEAITGWLDSNLANQNFQLLFSLNGGPFVAYGAFESTTDTISENNGDNSILQTLTSSGPGPIASGVTAVQFIFSTPGGSQAGSGGTLIRELQVFGAPMVNLTIQKIAGGQVQLVWPQGTLLQTDDLMGPWATNTAASPYTITPAEMASYYRVRVQ